MGWLVWLGVVGQTGCFFTQDINSPPQAQIENETGGIPERGTVVVFSARKSDDPNNHRLTVDWTALTCSADRTVCDNNPAYQTQNGSALDEPFEVMIPYRRDGADEPLQVLAVEAVVTDERGATHNDRLFVDVANLAPTVMLQPRGVTSTGQVGYPLGTAIRVLAAADDPEGDRLEYEWSYEAPVESVPGAPQWTMIDQNTYELVPDVEGLWNVRVNAIDELDELGTNVVAIDVRADAEPCIASVDPPYVADATYIVDRDGPERRFAVLNVTDDLDSHPPTIGDEFTSQFLGAAEFRWQVATPDTGGELVDVANHERSDYQIDASVYAPGDRLSLRVEIDDRQDRVIVCDPAAPTCSILGEPTCLQRVTWELEVR